ncbi:3-isopropylmalate/(R)-2-methylmalate dehydratase large subunit [Ruminococcaceae bacterium YRB3002]|nr:3-isopropylmalate/(R)-2-methylmalate dehydratase large subunit [Ruminococcaceae bacterium YRB3002]
MGMTITQKILAAHAGLDSVVPGQLIEASLDLVLGNDVTTPPAIEVFRKLGVDKVFDRDKVCLVPDHFTPNKDIKSAELSKCMRCFAREQEITHYYELGRRQMGIEHVILPDNGMVFPGDVIIGADSHTCTYGAVGAFSTGVGSTDLACAMARGKTWFKVPEAIKVVLHGAKAPLVTGKDIILHLIGMIGVDGALYKSLEFTGDGVKCLSMCDRLTMCNMAIECGAKNGIFAVDEMTLQYIFMTNPERVQKGAFKVYEADEDAEYSQVIEIDLAKVPLTVALPHLPSNTKPASEVKNMKINQVMVGSCTNGRLEDIRMAGLMMQGHKVHPDVRCIIIPGSEQVYRAALDEGILAVLDDAGCVISTPTCGPCLGGHMGVLAAGERCVSTTNRNFVGRMGHVDSEVILAGVPVACASAILGRVGTPDELMALRRKD